MAAPAITIIKSFEYRGATEEWSNTYELGVAAPGNDTDWLAMCMGLANEEKTILLPSVTYERFLGYDVVGNPATFSYDLRAHTATFTGTRTLVGVEGPGDSAGWVRWKTPDLTSTGRPIYLRKYFHGVDIEAEGTALDLMATGWNAAAVAFGEAIADSGTPLAGGFTLGDKHGNTDFAPVAASIYITTRTLKRRGRRP